MRDTVRTKATFEPVGSSQVVFPATHHRPAWYHLALPFHERRALLFIGDLLFLAAAGAATIEARSLLQDPRLLTPQLQDAQILWLSFLSAMWMGLGIVNECYSARITAHPMKILSGLMITAVEVGLLYLLIFFFFGREVFLSSVTRTWLASFVLRNPLPRVSPGVFLAVSWILIACWRLVCLKLFTSNLFRRKALIVGAGRSGCTVARIVRETVEDYELIGFVDDEPEKQGLLIDGLQVLGNRYDLLRLAQVHGANEIILATTQNIHKDLFNSLMTAYELGIAVKPMALLSEELLGRVPVEHLGQDWFLASCWNNAAMPTFYRTFKRLVDIVLSLIGLSVLAVLLPFITIAIYLDSPGSIFYTQERVGKGGKIFKVIKFRSMIPDAEEKQEPVWAVKGDPRITRIGNFIRRIRLDEAPQFLNILKGEMSIVGPRPERPQFVEDLQQRIPFYRARLCAKPGLTGWAQVKYHYGSTVEEAAIKLQYDLYYAKHQSFMLDLLIILRTVRIMLTMKGT